MSVGFVAPSLSTDFSVHTVIIPVVTPPLCTTMFTLEYTRLRSSTSTWRARLRGFESSKSRRRGSELDLRRTLIRRVEIECSRALCGSWLSLEVVQSLAHVPRALDVAPSLATWPRETPSRELDERGRWRTHDYCFKPCDAPLLALYVLRCLVTATDASGAGACPLH